MTTVAISGHRPGQKYTAREAVRSALLEIFARLPAPVTLISALAEGADRDAADAALATGAELIALTPFDHDAYCRDFNEPASVETFEALLGRAHRVEQRTAEIEPNGAYGPKRDAAYADAGFAMLERADMLIAVWDGRAGPYGGTSTIVSSARARGMPVVWIDSHGQRPPRLLRPEHARPAPYSDSRLRRALKQFKRGAR